MHALNFDDFLHLLGWENGDSRKDHLEEGVTIQHGDLDTVDTQLTTV